MGSMINHVYTKLYGKGVVSKIKKTTKFGTYLYKLLSIFFNLHPKYLLSNNTNKKLIKEILYVWFCQSNDTSKLIAFRYTSDQSNQNMW